MNLPVWNLPKGGPTVVMNLPKKVLMKVLTFYKKSSWASGNSGNLAFSHFLPPEVNFLKLKMAGFTYKLTGKYVRDPSWDF